MENEIYISFRPCGGETDSLKRQQDENCKTSLWYLILLSFFKCRAEWPVRQSLNKRQKRGFHFCRTKKNKIKPFYL